MIGKNTALRTSLEKAIQNWVDNNCESPEWSKTDIYFGEQTVDFMADAAMAVLLACADSTNTAIADGLLKET